MWKKENSVQEFCHINEDHHDEKYSHNQERLEEHDRQEDSKDSGTDSLCK